MDKVVVVLRRQGRVIALAVDEILNLVPRSGSEPQKLVFARSATHCPLFSHTIETGNATALLLMPERLYDQPRMPCAHEATLSQAHGFAAASEMLILLECGPFRLAIPCDRGRARFRTPA